MARLVFVDAMPFLGEFHMARSSKMTAGFFYTWPYLFEIPNLSDLFAAGKSPGHPTMGSGIQEVQPRLQDKKARKNHNQIIWVCLKIVYPYTQWLMIIIPTKWL